MPYTLSDRQGRAYTDLCDLWRPVDAIPTDDYPSDTVYELVETAVPCRFVPRSSVDQPHGPLGQVEGDDLQTTDELRLPENCPVDNNWIAVNRSLQDDDAEGPYFGKGWILRGEPLRRVSREDRPAGRVVAYVSRLPDTLLPAEIREHYA